MTREWLCWSGTRAQRPRERLCALTMGHVRSLSGWDLAGPRCGGRARAASGLASGLTEKCVWWGTIHVW